MYFTRIGYPIETVLARVRRADLPPLKVIQLEKGIGKVVQTPVPLDDGMKFSCLLTPKGVARIDCMKINDEAQEDKVKKFEVVVKSKFEERNQPF